MGWRRTSGRAIFGKAIRTAHAIESGWVQINQGLGQFPGQSYGGYKQSGIGREYSLEGMLDSYTQRKSITINLPLAVGELRLDQRFALRQSEPVGGSMESPAACRSTRWRAEAALAVLVAVVMVVVGGRAVWVMSTEARSRRCRCGAVNGGRRAHRPVCRVRWRNPGGSRAHWSRVTTCRASRWRSP